MAPPNLNSSSPQIIARARCIDPNAGKCLLQNVDVKEGATVEPVYAMPPNVDLIRWAHKFEWAWNMCKGSLIFDASRNIFFADSSLKALYKSGAFALLPEESDLDAYSANPASPISVALPREEFPTIERPSFRYTLVPFGDAMKSVIISRLGADGHIETHAYPFSTLPKLTSHIHPTYAIVYLWYCNGNPKLDMAERARLRTTYPTLEKASNICASWHRWATMGIIRALESNHESSQAVESDSSVQSSETGLSNRTPPRRLLPKRACPSSATGNPKRTKLDSDVVLNKMVLQWLKQCTPPPSDDEDIPQDASIECHAADDALGAVELDMDSASQVGSSDDGST